MRNVGNGSSSGNLDPEAAVQRVIQLDQDDESYAKMLEQPLILNNRFVSKRFPSVFDGSIFPDAVKASIEDVACLSVATSS